MAGLFRRNNKPQPQRSVSREEVESLLPASVRHPEANRFTPLGSDFAGEEGSDEDIEFLESIVKEVELQEIVQPRRLVTKAAPVKTPVISQEDAMSFFREKDADREERARDRIHVEVEEVEMFDLLEDLSTTAAALRRRKAA
jgi:hypothetical protein